MSALFVQAVSTAWVSASHWLQGRGHCVASVVVASDGLVSFAKKLGKEGLAPQSVHWRSAVAVALAEK